MPALASVQLLIVPCSELARVIAREVFGGENALVKIDMSEFGEKHNVSRLVGAPAGYIGYDDGGKLTEAVRRKPYSVILLDEIEKAHPDVFNVLLQVLDDGHITDSQGRKVDFKNTIIIMTSNMGAYTIQENFQRAMSKDGEVSADIVELTRNEVVEQLKQHLKPEFLNRIDEIVMFEPLSEKDIAKIVDIQLGITYKMLKQSGIELRVTDKARAWIAHIGFDAAYGARPVKRVIQREVINELSKRILAGRVDKSKPIVIDISADALSFNN